MNVWRKALNISTVSGIAVPADTGYASPPPIERVEELHGKTRYHFYLTPTMPVFADHFPRYGLVPGVLQIHWVMQLIQGPIPEHSQYRILRLKFTRPMIPAKHYVLEVAQPAPSTLKFRYLPAAGSDIYSSGTVEFAS